MPNTDHSILKEFRLLLEAHSFRLSYTALRDEQDPNNIPLLSKIQTEDAFLIPQTPLTDPIALAANLSKTLIPSKTHILIPGQAFDLSGTRHGRGNGWYDRFLAHLPKEMPRIGIVPHGCLSTTPLIRQTWDEPMDWLLYQTQETWLIHKTNTRNH
ncbi:hypothetical protein KBD61_03810 [Patescibacteria group bacterium]|nr:hypothetical protein [Patescibacteria group bacterium]MBP9710122.1 hypothetical protein [Patescibacteria group bacterium]